MYRKTIKTDPFKNMTNIGEILFASFSAKIKFPFKLLISFKHRCSIIEKASLEKIALGFLTD